MIAAWSVDRLGRSLQDLVGFLTELRALGCDLYLHQQALDTSTPSGLAMFQMLGVFAEFECGMIRERVNAGLARAKGKGTKLGRRPVKPSVEARIRELRAEGMGILKFGGASASALPWCSGFCSKRQGLGSDLIVSWTRYSRPGRPFLL
jgi:DNA invertase Pin-like site-specific DNA recombinase